MLRIDTAIEHQALVAPVRGHQADPAPCCSGGVAGQVLAVGEVDLAARGLTGPEEHAQERGHAGPFQAGQADDLARSSLEGDVVQLVAHRQACHREVAALVGVGIGMRCPRRKELLLRRPHHPFHDIRHREFGAVAGEGQPAVAHDRDAVGDGKDLFEAM